jgi:hypothetical protein
MKKILISLLSFFILLTPVFGSTKHKKKKNSKSSVSKTHSKIKSKKKRRHGRGPDIKKLTTESPYTDDPNNGVNNIENNRAN